MKVLKNKRLHVNMGQYEHMEIIATVEVNTETDTDLLAERGVDVNDLEAVRRFIDVELTRLIEPDVDDAHFQTANADSFIHEHRDQLTDRKN